MSRVEMLRTVDAPVEDVFHFTEWCYNGPEWMPFVQKAWITELPGPDGLGGETHYVGEMMGKEETWEATSTKFEANTLWAGKATAGDPAKMNMGAEVRFREVEPGKTEVRIAMSYKVPYPVVGWFLDRFYVRRDVRKMIEGMVEGIERAAAQSRIPSLAIQLKKREEDHPGYQAQK